MNSASSSMHVDQWLKLNESIVALDPLKFDQRISLLHTLNRSKDIKGIIQLLYDMLPMPDALDRYTYEQAVACMRDLGIFIGIIKRHGVEPVEAVPELEYVLLVLMVKTDLPPRDTLIHYTLCNPRGERMRMYTGLSDERCLIESVQISMPDLWRAIVQLEALHECDFADPSFIFNCHSFRDKLTAMVRGIVHAKKNVSPAVFANELRFYYDPIKVDYNKDYIGPGAVEMPMFVIDHLLWSSDCDDTFYTQFKEGYLPYNLQFIRDIYWGFKGKPSLVSRVAEEVKNNPSEGTFRAAQVVMELANVLKSFRMPHKKLAESAYAQHDDHHRSEGSGGYSTDILSHILALQSEKFQILQHRLVLAGS